MHVYGKRNSSADAWSRCPVEKPSVDEITAADKIELFASSCYLPATDVRLERLAVGQKSEEELKFVSHKIVLRLVYI